MVTAIGVEAEARLKFLACVRRPADEESVSERERIRLEQHVRVLEVARAGRRVTVDVYGGARAGATCGIVVYDFPDHATSEEQEQVLRSWRDAGTVLTFVHRDDEVALIDDLAQFQASWAATPDNDFIA